jgi:hypothetical protein
MKEDLDFGGTVAYMQVARTRLASAAGDRSERMRNPRSCVQLPCRELQLGGAPPFPQGEVAGANYLHFLMMATNG